MERVGQRDEHEWIILKEIAETLNSRNDMDDMLNSVLEKLLHMTGLECGWILLSEHEPDYTCAADCRLPPALRSRDRLAMRTDSCWCLMRLWSGELRGAVNTIGCKRIDDAVRFKWGDTEGITHHATVPLEAGGQAVRRAQRRRCRKGTLHGGRTGAVTIGRAPDRNSH